MFPRWCLRSASRKILLLGQRQRLHSIRHSTTRADASTSKPSNKVRRRTPFEIQALVQQRVKERDSWSNEEPPSLRELLKFLRQLYFEFQPPSRDELDRTFRLQNLQWERLQNPSQHGIQMTWIGHASVLIQLNGWNILADPVFSNRCSPFQWAGPQRYHPPPCNLDELVQKLTIDLVLISHNHYDHLDFHTVQYLANHTDASFVVPLGLAAWFERYVISKSSSTIHEQDWHETTQLHHPNGYSPPLSITALPMKHWTNRMGDRDQTLWCGFFLQSESLKVLFPGDTAWFEGLYKIGETYGPFHVAAIPIGAYEPRDFMKHHHIDVEEAIRMKDAVQAHHAVPIHWGTFPLTTEPTLEPRDRLLQLMQDRQDWDTFQPWLIGETKLFGENTEE